jgi:NADPH-dependent ferric siderophore reductase
VSDAPRIERIRHELKRRRLTVARLEKVGSKMKRVVLKGAELSGFTSPGFDDHIKVFFTGDTPTMRDFTPRRFDAGAQELWVDFFEHGAGPAAEWLARASVGDSLEIGGPKGSAVIGLEGIDAHVLIGDETALPAISRRLEEFPVGTRALVIVELDADSVQSDFMSRASLQIVKVRRGGIIDALRLLAFPRGNCFFWVACESGNARSIRRYLRDERKIDQPWIKAAGYWKRGAAGSHDKLADD